MALSCPPTGISDWLEKLQKSFTETSSPGASLPANARPRCLPVSAPAETKFPFRSRRSGPMTAWGEVQNKTFRASCT